MMKLEANGVFYESYRLNYRSINVNLYFCTIVIITEVAEMSVILVSAVQEEVAQFSITVMQMLQMIKQSSKYLIISIFSQKTD